MNVPNKLTITLTESEKGNIGGWVNFLASNPQFIGVPGRGDPNNPNRPITWQTRIVLEDQSRARFEEIAAQFGVSITSPPVVTPPATGSKGSDYPGFPDWPIEMLTPMWGGTRRSGDQGETAGPWYNPRAISVIPIVIPSTPKAYGNPILSMGIAEYRSPPSYKISSLSRIPGDFHRATVINAGGGTTSTSNAEIGKDVHVGETIYYNFCFWMPNFDDPFSKVGQPSTGEEQQGAVVGGGWPNQPIV